MVKRAQRLGGRFNLHRGRLNFNFAKSDGYYYSDVGGSRMIAVMSSG